MIIYWRGTLNVIQNAVGRLILPGINCFYSAAAEINLYDVSLDSVSATQPGITASVTQPSITTSVTQPSVGITVKNKIQS